MRLLMLNAFLIVGLIAYAQTPPNQTIDVGNITGSVTLPTGASSESTQQQVLSTLSSFAPGGTGTVKIQDGVGNPLTSQLNGAQQALDVGVNVAGVQIDPRDKNWFLTDATDAITAFQGGSWTSGRTWNLLSGSDSVDAVQSGSWSTGRTWSLLNSTDSVDAVQSGTWTVQQGTPPWSVSQSGSWTSGRTWTLDFSTDSVTIPLPVNAATETTMAAFKSANHTDLSTINSTLGSPFQAGGSIGNTTFAATQSGAWNITNVTGTVSLPTGASTETTLSALNGKVPSGLTVTSTRLLVDGSGVTQPVSGTFWQATQPVSGTFWQATQPVSGTFWQATQPVSIASMPSTPVTGIFWQATQPISSANQDLAQGSTTLAQVGPLVQGATTTSAPTYTTAKTNPLSLTTAGALRVDNSAVTQPVSGTFWQSTQPVSIASMPSTPVTGTFWQSTQPVSIATAPVLVAGSAIIGKVGIDQTTPGTTNGVQVNAALPAGSNVIGHVIADSGSTTVVTGNVASTVADGSNVTLGAKADAKSTATDTTAITIMSVLKEISAMEQAPASRAVTNAGTFATQSTLAAETTKVIGTINVAASQTIGISAGSAVIGHVIADSGSTTAVTGTVATNVSQINGVTPLMGNGSTGTGSQRVTIASDNTAFSVNASSAQSGTWTVQPGNTANTTAWLMTINDGTNSAKVQAASTAAVAADKALTVVQSPNGLNPCMNPAATLVSITGATSGTANVQIIALSGTTKIYVCALTVIGVSGTTPTFSLVSGTGSNCASATTTVLQAWTTTAGSLYAFANPVAVTTAAHALCYKGTGTTPVQNYALTYVQQ